ncbi:MAG: nickel pincer cofactor biosynthesis protein LarB [Bacteroidales bacterium]
MQKEKLRQLLTDIREGKVKVENALEKIQNLPFEDLGFANLDHHRSLRKGHPEIVFCENKTPEQVGEIFKRLSEYNNVLGTRASTEMYEQVLERLPGAVYHPVGRTITYENEKIVLPADESKHILVITAGTTDIPVAEEAIETARFMGNHVRSLFDVGVAGIHRLFNNKHHIDNANVIIVVAGMDGALPSVVGGLVDKPVIAVPTSVGYGASFNGIGPLLTMLNACAPGVCVMNIDNGFGAGYFASMVNK